MYGIWIDHAVLLNTIFVCINTAFWIILKLYIPLFSLRFVLYSIMPSRFYRISSVPTTAKWSIYTKLFSRAFLKIYIIFFFIRIKTEYSRSIIQGRNYMETKTKQMYTSAKILFLFENKLSIDKTYILCCIK
jgi:hypothetical protein